MRKEDGGVHVTPITVDLCCLFRPLSRKPGGCWPLLILVVSPGNPLYLGCPSGVERGEGRRGGGEDSSHLASNSHKSSRRFLTSRKISGMKKRILIRLVHSWSRDHLFCFPDHFMEMESQSIHQFVITCAASRESQSITPTPGKHYTEAFKEV